MLNILQRARGPLTPTTPINPMATDNERAMLALFRNLSDRDQKLLLDWFTCFEGAIRERGHDRASLTRRAQR